MTRRLIALLTALLLVAACSGTTEPSGSATPTPTPTPTLSYLNEGVATSGDLTWLSDGKSGNYLVTTVAGSDGSLSSEIYHATTTTITTIRSSAVVPAVVGVFGGDLVVADTVVDIAVDAGAAALSTEAAAVSFSRINSTGEVTPLTVTAKVRTALLWLASYYTSDVQGTAFADGVAFATMDPFPSLPMGSYYLDASLALTPLVAAVGDQSVFTDGDRLWVSGYNATNTGGNAAFSASKVKPIASCVAKIEATQKMSFVARVDGSAAGGATLSDITCLADEAGRVVQFGVSADAAATLFVGIGGKIFYRATEQDTSASWVEGDLATLPTRPAAVGQGVMAFVSNCLDREGSDDTCVDSSVSFTEWSDAKDLNSVSVTLLAYRVWAVAPVKDGNAYISAVSADGVSIYYVDATARPSVAVRVGEINMTGNTTGSFKLAELNGKIFLCTNGSVYRVSAANATLLGQGDCYAAADALWIAAPAASGSGMTFRALDLMR